MSRVTDHKRIAVERINKLNAEMNKRADEYIAEQIERRNAQFFGHITRKQAEYLEAWFKLST